MWEPTAYDHNPGLIFMRLSRVYMQKRLVILQRRWNPSWTNVSQALQKVKGLRRCARVTLIHVRKDHHRNRSCDKVVGYRHFGLTNNAVRVNDLS